MNALSLILSSAQNVTSGGLPRSTSTDKIRKAKKAAAGMNQPGRTNVSDTRPSLNELKQKAKAEFQSKKENVEQKPKHYLKKISNQQMSLTPFKVNQQQARELVQTGIDIIEPNDLKDLDPGQLGELLSSICTEPADESQIFKPKDLERMEKILTAAKENGCLNEVVNYTRDYPDEGRSESPLERIVHSNQNHRKPLHDQAMGELHDQAMGMLLDNGAEVTAPMKERLKPKRSFFGSSQPIQYTAHEQQIKDTQTRQEKIRNAEEQINQYYDNDSPIPGDTSFYELIKRDVLDFCKALEEEYDDFDDELEEDDDELEETPPYEGSNEDSRDYFENSFGNRALDIYKNPKKYSVPGELVTRDLDTLKAKLKQELRQEFEKKYNKTQINATYNKRVNQNINQTLSHVNHRLRKKPKVIAALRTKSDPQKLDKFLKDKEGGGYAVDDTGELSGTGEIAEFINDIREDRQIQKEKIAQAEAKLADALDKVDEYIETAFQINIPT